MKGSLAFVLGLTCWSVTPASAQIVHDAEYDVLESQHAEEWAA